MAALAEEEPNENEDRAAEDEETDFDRHGPAGGEENKGIHDAEVDSVEIAAGEDDFLGKREIAVGERTLSTVIWMAEELTVENEFENATDERVVDNYDYTDNPVDLKGAE